MNPDPKTLNLIGLSLNTVSGLLLIPQVLRLLPVERIETSMEKMLQNLENWSKLPIYIHPKSWQRVYSEEQRANIIEPLTAVPTLLFSLAWISVLLGGILFRSKFLILFSFILPSYISLQRIQQYWNMPISQVKKWRIKVILTALIAVFLLAGPFSLLRVMLFLFKKFIHLIRSYFSRHSVLESALLIFAIISFILSNILQIWATILE